MPVDTLCVAVCEYEPRCVVCEQPESPYHPVRVCDGCLAAAREQWEALPADERERLLREAEEV